MHGSDMEGANDAPGRFPARRSWLAVGLLAMLAYLPGFWWGAPHATAPDRTNAWGVDDETPLGPIAQVYNIARPQEFQNLGYPLMHSFAVVAAYSPYLAVARLTGDLAEPSPEYPFGLADPVRMLRDLSWIAHLLSVLMAAGIVVAAFLTGAVLWGERTGRLAALFVLVSFPMFYYSRTGNVDVPALFFAALAVAGFALALVDGLTLRRSIWIGTLVGFSVATKETHFALFLAFPPLLIWLAGRNGGEAPGGGAAANGDDPGEPGERMARVRLVLAAALACLIAFGIGSGLFVDPDRYMAHLDFIRDRVQRLGEADIAHVVTYPGTLGGNAALVGRTISLLADAMTLPALVLAGVGLVWSLRDGRRAWIGALAVSYLAVLLIVARAGQLRFVMPAAFVLLLFTARAVEGLFRSGRVGRWAGIGAVVWIAGLGIVGGVGLTGEMIADSRYDAGGWLATRATPGDVVAYFGPPQKLPPLPAGVASERAVVYKGAVRGLLEHDPEAVWSRWETDPPAFVVIMPDHSSPPGELRSAFCPPAVVDGLESGRLGYRLAASFHTAPLFGWPRRPALDYPSVNPVIRVFTRGEGR